MSIASNRPPVPEYAQRVRANFPAELHPLKQWLRYRLVPKKDGSGKLDKIPYDPFKPEKASVDDPSTWGTLEDALDGLARLGGDGVGIVFTEDDPYCGADGDNSIDPGTGGLKEWAGALFEKLPTYTELSPSGTGVHAIGRGKAGAHHRRPYQDGQIEIYSQGRFFTVTGLPINGSPATVNDVHDGLTAIHALVWPEPWYATEDTGPQPDTNGRYAKPSYGPTGLPDAEVLDRCRSDADADTFIAIYDNADLFDVDGDDSRADWFVWNKLVFYLGNDVERIIQLAEQGAHFLHPGNEVKAKERKNKWHRPDAAYGTLERATLAKILADRTWATIYSGGRVSIDVNVPLHVVVDKTLAELGKANSPERGTPILFVYGGAISRIHTDENNLPSIKPITPAGIRVEIDRIINYVQITPAGRNKKKRVTAKLPQDLIPGVLAEKSFPFAPLVGITEVPVFRPDGSLVTTSGYDVPTGLLYRPPADGSLVLPPVPDAPSSEQVRDAWQALHYVFWDFPFASPADRANLMGLLVSLVVRPAIKGRIPLALLDAPTGGTGKGLAAEVVAIIATGHSAGMLQATDNEEEWRKRITATLLAGRPFTCIDNVETTLTSATLASMFTAEEYIDRVLGESRTITVQCEQIGVWCATGNNISVGGTLPRRSYRIRLDAKIPNPYLRPATEFRHPRLREWVREHRAELLYGLLVVVRAWYAAGKPTVGAPNLGNFEAWAETVWGILSLDPTLVDPAEPGKGCFGSYFLANGQELWSQGDGDSDEWLAFLIEAEIAFAHRDYFTAVDVQALVKTDREYTVAQEQLRNALPGDLRALADSPKFTKVLGHTLKRHEDTRYGDDMHRVVRVGDGGHAKVAQWRVVHGN